MKPQTLEQAQDLFRLIMWQRMQAQAHAPQAPAPVPEPELVEHVQEARAPLGPSLVQAPHVPRQQPTPVVQQPVAAAKVNKWRAYVDPSQPLVYTAPPVVASKENLPKVKAVKPKVAKAVKPAKPTEDGDSDDVELVEEREGTFPTYLSLPCF